MVEAIINCMGREAINSTDFCVHRGCVVGVRVCVCGYRHDLQYEVA